MTFLRWYTAEDEDAILDALYKIFIEQQEPERKLYLAIPTHAFKNIFQREVGKLTFKKFNINLIVYSIEKEGSLLWNPL